MNYKNKRIMDEYRAALPGLERLNKLVPEVLRKAIEAEGIRVHTIEHRVKSYDSLAEKLDTKEGKYRHLADITDVLGLRIICYFSDDVDRICAIIERLLTVDWDNSVDKREKLNANAFGYMSVHYVVALPEDSGYDTRLCGTKFEVQVRTILQHTWAEIEHDLGYKSDFGVPRSVRRKFSCIASLLELADEQFQQVRDDIHHYGDEIRHRIAENDLDGIAIDLLSLQEYTAHNKPIRAFLDELAAIADAKIGEVSPENFLHQLAWLGMTQLSEIDRMLCARHDLALALARQAMENADLDIISSTIALRYLCQAELLATGADEEKLVTFLMLSSKDAARVRRQAQQLLESGRTLMFDTMKR